MTQISDDFLLQLAETEYGTVDPRYARPARFGTFYSHPCFPDRFDANQLCRTSCTSAELPDMLAELEQCYAGLDLGFRKVSGYAPAVWAHLGAALIERGWSALTCDMMLLQEQPTREVDPSLDVRPVSPDSADLEVLYTSGGELNRGFVLARSEFQRMGGEYLIGYLGGVPACCTGWFVHDRVARFRHVLTARWARGRGCATSIIQHVQRHPEVRRQDGLVIFVGSDGPARLYHDLGFRKVGEVWEAKVMME